MKSDWLLAVRFAEMFPRDAARVLERLHTDNAVEFINAADPALSAEIMQSMDRIAAVQCLKTMDPLHATDILSNMPSSIAAALLRSLENNRRTAIIDGFSQTIKKAVNANLQYRENTAGAMMNTFIITIPHDIVIKEALANIKRNKQHVHTHIYVTDQDNKFVGMLKFRDILLTDPGTSVSEIMRRRINYIMPQTSIRLVLGLPSWKQYLALPVVDQRGVLLGELDLETIVSSQHDTSSIDMTRPAEMAGKALIELYAMGVLSLCRELRLTSPVVSQAHSDLSHK